MHLRVNLKFLGAILVHPVRRQNFAGTGAPQILQHLRLCHMQYALPIDRIDIKLEILAGKL